MIRPPNLHPRPPVRKAIDLDALAREIARRVLAEPPIQNAIAKSTRPPAPRGAARPHPGVQKLARALDEARAIAKTAPRVLGAAVVEPFKELRQVRRDLAAKTEQFNRFAETLTKSTATSGRGGNRVR